MRFFRKLRFALATFSLVATTSAASAATVTFDLTGNLAATDHSFEMSVGGVTALFEGFTFDRLRTRNNTIVGHGRTSVREANIGRYGEGAGVSNGWWDSHAVDSANGVDFIQMTLLSGALAINNVTFGFVHNGLDDFRWMWDRSGDGEIGGGDFISGNVDISANGASYGGMYGQVSNVFGFAAANDRCGLWCSLPSFWKLESVTFDIAAVPLPASWLLMLAALGGLVTVGRRRET